MNTTTEAVLCGECSDAEERRAYVEGRPIDARRAEYVPASEGAPCPRCQARRMAEAERATTA